MENPRRANGEGSVDQHADRAPYTVEPSQSQRPTGTLRPRYEPEKHVIVIDYGPFGPGDGFTVRIDPAPEGDSLDMATDDYRRARGWASGLRLTHGWRIRDLVEGKA